MGRIGLAWLACWSLLALLYAQRLTVVDMEGLGPISGGEPLRGFSGNGQVVLGDFHSRITHRSHLAIWTLQEGWWYLKRDGGLTRNPREAIWGYAKAISYDGSIVLGYDLAVSRPFRWRRGRGVEHLQCPPGASVAVGDFLSWDGGWVGGQVAFPRGTGEEWWVARWSPEGRVELIEGSLMPRAMSATGREMVGTYGYFVACRWREGEGFRLFWEPFTRAVAVSADGAIAAGRFIDRNPPRFCVGRWFVDEYRMECAISDTRILSIGMSADGRLISGAYDIAPEEDLIEPRAFLWEEGRGWVDLNEVYGWLFGENIAESAGISADGRYLVVSILTPPLPGGYRLGAEGILDRFGVHGDVTGDDCVDDADLLRLLFAFGREGWRPEDVNVDRVVNEQDLLIVLSGFGECAN